MDEPPHLTREEECFERLRKLMGRGRRVRDETRRLKLEDVQHAARECPEAFRIKDKYNLSLLHYVCLSDHVTADILDVFHVARGGNGGGSSNGGGGNDGGSSSGSTCAAVGSACCETKFRGKTTTSCDSSYIPTLPCMEGVCVPSEPRELTSDAALPHNASPVDVESRSARTCSPMDARATKIARALLMLTVQ